MQRKRQKLQNVLAERTSIGHSLMKDQCHFCFSCEQMFPNRIWLEEHSCPAASYICSCGTEFPLYVDMLEHSNTHQPGHQVLDHQTIRKRRFEKHREQEEQLRRLQSAEQGLWTVPRLDTVPAPSLKMGSKSQVPMKSTLMSKVPMQSARISQVQLMSQAPLLPNPKPTARDITTVLTGADAQTVDLWTLYQPVVLVKTLRQFAKKKPYSCGKCEQGFTIKSSLTLHHNTHAMDKVFGCLGCGMLLSSKKSVPRYHQCDSPSSSLKVRLITARPLSYRKPNEADTNRNRNPCVSDKRNQQLPVTACKELQLNTPTRSESRVWKKPVHACATNRFTCRVCHIPFGTIQLLQRHKCAKAQEFVKQQALYGKQSNRHMNVPTVKSQYHSQINGQKMVLANGNMKTHRDMAVGLDRGLVVCPVNGKIDIDLEDDCYIVEGPPAKPAQMMYHLTSSLPVIKT